MNLDKSSDTKLKKIKIDKITYLIDLEEKTAGILKAKHIGDIIIPRSIKFESQEYAITKILELSFYGSVNFWEVDFDPDSEIRTIEKDSFHCTSIQKITIPPSLVELKERWCNNTPDLTKFTVLSNNPVYTSYENKFIIGKSSPTKENYDVLVFASRDITEAIIPDFIEIIGPYSFSFCTNLKQVIFPINSKVRIIDKYAFLYTSLESISIPPQITKICEYCFAYSKFFHIIDIPLNSKLKTIENNAFHCTNIDSFLIPSSLIELKKGWFDHTSNLTRIRVMQNNPVYASYEDKFIICKSTPI